MAVTLPTLTVTDAQGSRILDAFKRNFGVETQAEAILAYKRWLATALREVVVQVESEQMQLDAAATLNTQIAAIRADLLDPNTVT